MPSLSVDLTNEMVESKLTSSSGQICRFTDVPRSVCNYREIQNALTFHYLPSSVGLAQTKVATTSQILLSEVRNSLFAQRHGWVINCRIVIRRMVFCLCFDWMMLSHIGMIKFSFFLIGGIGKMASSDWRGLSNIGVLKNVQIVHWQLFKHNLLVQLQASMHLLHRFIE